MMSSVKKILFVSFFLLTTNYFFAQDIIIKKNGEQIKAKIIEIGKTEIKFKYFDAPDGPIIVLEKREIKTMKLEGKTTDKTITVTEDPMSTSNAIIVDKTSSIKFHFFSPLSHKLAFSYEWMIRPSFNWEVGAGVIGPGVSAYDNAVNGKPSGGFIRTGPKFLLGNSSDVEVEGQRIAHPLKGRYFKIEALFNSFSKTYDNGQYYSNGAHVRSTDKITCGALHLIYGRQYIFGNAVTLGWSIGIGYAFESKNTNSPVINVNNNPTVTYYDNFYPGRYSHIYFGKDFPLTFTSSFTIGYIFKTPAWIDNIGNHRTSNRPPSRHSLNND